MRNIYVTIFAVLWVGQVLAQSEPSTYFNIFVPPNNEAIKRDVALVVTAVSDSTYFSIIDDDMDGDTDDSVSGMLMSGQSYILYFRDNGINDDAMYASGGTLRRDGDYFIITADKLVYASMSTDSDWQHDFVPAVNKKSVGQKFYVYSPKVSSSPRDLNVFAYEEGTTVSIFKISKSPTTQTGYTNVDLENRNLVLQKTIKPGEDIIYHSTGGRDLMESGGSYLIESNKEISVQYGALWGNARDGGAYVPSSNGSASGDLLYFSVPFQASGEQEIRIVSWDQDNSVQLSRYQNGTWIPMNQWTLGKYQPADWVGKQNGNATFSTVFRVSCSPGKRVSVMEANWMETGSTNTSDMSTMLSAESGTSSGKMFLAYMLPPSSQNNVFDPFSGKFFQGSVTHFYLFASSKSTSVTIKDAKTNGKVLSKTYQIEAGRYADAVFDMNEWRSIYNGTGTPSGPERPYVLIESTENISVLSTNFNDNWMNYFGSSLPQSFTQSGSISNREANPGQKVVLETEINTNSNQKIENVSIEVKVGSGLIPVECKLKNNGKDIQNGQINTGSQGTVFRFDPIPVVTGSDRITTETTVIAAPTYNDGSPVPNESVISIETIASGTVNDEFQQSIYTQGLKNNSSNTSNLLYSLCQIQSIGLGQNSSWNLAWIDYDNDGHEDLFVPTKDGNAPNELYRNNGKGSFTRIVNHPLVNEQANTVASVWGDINNDGRKDVFLVNATQHKSKIFVNNGNGSFSELKNSGIDVHPQYFHGAAFADFDNDGFLDLIVTNFFETRFHQLYRNNGDNTFTRIADTAISMESERAMAPILADFDNDGLVDVFIPNGNDKPNSLFRNLGNFQFEKIIDKAISADAKNSVGAAWGDFDNDGLIDLVVVNASQQNNDLYRNLGGGVFQKMEDTIISRDRGDSHGVAWLDANNDGYLDLYITNNTGPSFFYINDGKGGFTKKMDELVVGNLGKAMGVAVGDYNKDGYLDLGVATFGDARNRIFCHNADAGNWIGFQLQGEYSNKQAIGARVAIKTGEEWQFRQLLPVSGFGSQHTQLIHFGVGDAKTVDNVVVTWPSGVSQVIKEFKVGQYNRVLEDGGKKVQGIVFHDLNANGKMDADEPSIPNVRLSINGGKINPTSNSKGYFDFYTNDESVEVSLMQQHWAINPAYTKFKFGLGEDVLSLELPIKAVDLGYDLSISISTTAWRRGFTNETTVMVSNLGTEVAKNATAEIVFPEEAYLQSADRKFSEKSPKAFVWELGDIDPGTVLNIQLVDSIGLNAKIGQKLNLVGLVSAEGKDLIKDNNRVEEEVEVVGAIDPNDILVSPKGDGPQGFIHKSQSLTYTIRFENVGTYKATYVFLENKIPEGLELGSFEILSASHPYTYSLTADRMLRVAYRYIDLPPAMLDSIGAHGYFKYRIRPKIGIEEGTVIENDAKIFFDFEDPLVTNTVLNTIKFSGKQEVRNLKVYPNPAVDAVYFSIEEDFNRLVEPRLIAYWVILDASGRQLLSGLEDQVAEIKVSVANLPKGLYFIRASTRSGETYAGKLLKD